jgi:elongation factor Ts
MNITMDAIKELREMTSCGVIECKKALEEAKGDMNQAKQILQKRGLELAAKKGDRAAKEGRVEVYIHPGSKMAAMVEVNCETDFVANSEEFKKFTKDVAMHIAACSPKYVKKEDVPAEALAGQHDAESFYKENCLLSQAYVKDPKMTIQDYLNTLVSSIRENIIISRFVRYKVSEID